MSEGLISFKALFSDNTKVSEHSLSAVKGGCVNEVQLISPLLNGFICLAIINKHYTPCQLKDGVCPINSFIQRKTESSNYLE